MTYHLVCFQVDVIVNSTAPNLQLNVGLISSSLLKVGGEILQDECLRNAPGGVRDGDVVVTSGGQLQCQFVVHGSCTGWMNGDGRCLQVRDSHILAGTFTSAFNGVSACAGILYLVSCAVNL